MKMDLYAILRQICVKYCYNVILNLFRNIAGNKPCEKRDILHEIKDFGKSSKTSSG